jgi:hypothetical protein
MRRYKVTYGGAEWDAQVGDSIELALTPEEETELVQRGRLEVEPREYLVVGGQEVHDAPHGETFRAALTAGEEAALISGGHVELVDEEKLEDLKKDELLERATVLGIEGRDAMKKDELIDAIRSLDEEKGGNT